MSKINETLLKWEAFKFATSLNLNIGYYQIQLNEDASKWCTIIIPQGNYCYKSLPIRVSNSLDSSQHKMKNFYQCFEFISACIENLFISTKGDWAYNIRNRNSLWTN